MLFVVRSFVVRGEPCPTMDVWVVFQDPHGFSAALGNGRSAVRGRWQQQSHHSRQVRLLHEHKGKPMKDLKLQGTKEALQSRDAFKVRLDVRRCGWGNRRGRTSETCDVAIAHECRC
jgi:hypothetical protein